jgi:hypothetical protein
MPVLAYAAAVIMALLGVLHLVYTLYDFGPKPLYFRPSDASVLEAMRVTRTNLAPDGRDYWSGVLGFNLSHSIGVLLFALLISVATQYGIGWLKPVLVAVGIIYAAISYRCWFNIPTTGIGLATVLLIVGWW